MGYHVKQEIKRCHLCGCLATDRHHMINGLAFRSKSEEYGLVVYLCRSCHNEVHFGLKSRELSDKLKKEAQLKFEREHPDLDFQKVFRINFLDEDERKNDCSLDLKEKLPWEAD